MLLEQRPVCDGYDLTVQLADGSRRVLHSQTQVDEATAAAMEASLEAAIAAEKELLLTLEAEDGTVV